MDWIRQTTSSTHGLPRARGWALLGVLGSFFHVACADDSTAMTDTADGSGTTGTTTGTIPGPPTTGTTAEPPPTTTMSVTSTDTGTTTTTTDPTTTTTTDPTTTTTDPTTGTTTSTTTGTTSTTDPTDTDTDTDTDTGGELVGRSVTQTVNSGTMAVSPNFRMVFTMGQPTQNQGVYTSNNFRLQGGLIGANGNPP